MTAMEFSVAVLFLSIFLSPIVTWINHSCHKNYYLRIMKSIDNKEDLTYLIDQFYGKVLKDDTLAPFFKHFDMAAHMPRMVQFWAFALLDEHGYKGNVIEKHLHMPLKKHHFDRWVELFEGTLDEHFEGEKVTLAKQKVAVLRWTMESKIAD